MRAHSALTTALVFAIAAFSSPSAPDSADTEPTRAGTTTSGGTGDPWSLWSGGTRLRGANIFQRRVYPELDGPEFMGSGAVGPPYSASDFVRLAQLGANYVNISHPGLFTETPPYAVDQQVQAHLDNLLALIAAADLFAVISFRTGPGRSEFTFYWGEDGDWFDSSYYNDQVWVDDQAQQAWAAMWRHTASRYEDNPVVVGYDLMELFEQRGMNHALWVWDPSWTPWTEEVNAFNFLFGDDPNSQGEVASSDLEDAITEAWARNTVRPSTFAGGPCTPDAATLCLNNGRFAVTCQYATSQGQSGAGQAVKLTDDTGYLWFFDSDNVEAVVKVLDGCGVNGHHWVFAAGLTNVQVSMTVRDTSNGTTRVYSNPMGTSFQPVQDTAAFAGCR